MSDMTRDDIMRETIDHCNRVAGLLAGVSHKLVQRAVHHDRSKFSPKEFDLFAQETPRLRGMTYGSDEYKAALERLGPALWHHYGNNRHHPEHFENGISEMNLLDLIEMLADWKAATERHADGSLSRSINQNAARFGYDDAMRLLLRRTAQHMGWLDDPAQEDTQ